MLGVTTAFVGAAAVVGLLGEGSAAAAPLPIDHAIPPNGISAPGYPRTPVLTPPGSPIQVPTPSVTTTGHHPRYRAYPYFSEWFHDAIPVPPGAGIDAEGGIAATVTDPITHRVVTVDVAGHCLFVGRDLSADAAPTPLPRIRIDTPVLNISIDPTLLSAR